MLHAYLNFQASRIRNFFLEKAHTVKYGIYPYSSTYLYHECIEFNIYSQIYYLLIRHAIDIFFRIVEVKNYVLLHCNGKYKSFTSITHTIHNTQYTIHTTYKKRLTKTLIQSKLIISPFSLSLSLSLYLTTTTTTTTVQSTNLFLYNKYDKNSLLLSLSLSPLSPYLSLSLSLFDYYYYYYYYYCIVVKSFSLQYINKTIIVKNLIR